MAAVKNDVALVAFATGPYHAFGPEFDPGLPSGRTEIAGDMAKYVNSFRWKGDSGEIASRGNPSVPTHPCNRSSSIPKWASSWITVMATSSTTSRRCRRDLQQVLPEDRDGVRRAPP